MIEVVDCHMESLQKAVKDHLFSLRDEVCLGRDESLCVLVIHKTQ
jgi:hypothetical protein